MSTSLGNKTSDIIGYSGVNITENLYAEYNFSIDQNLQETNYSLATINYNNDKFENIINKKFLDKREERVKLIGENQTNEIEKRIFYN